MTNAAGAAGARPTKRARAKSAALWGLVGGFAFLVLAQGYLLVGGDIPFAYAGLFPVGGVIALITATIAYATEYRLRAKRRT